MALPKVSSARTLSFDWLIKNLYSLIIGSRYIYYGLYNQAGIRNWTY